MSQSILPRLSDQTIHNYLPYIKQYIEELTDKIAEIEEKERHFSLFNKYLYEMSGSIYVFDYFINHVKITEYGTFREYYDEDIFMKIRSKDGAQVIYIDRKTGKTIYYPERL